MCWQFEDYMIAAVEQLSTIFYSKSNVISFFCTFLKNWVIGCKRIFSDFQLFSNAYNVLKGAIEIVQLHNYFLVAIQ